MATEEHRHVIQFFGTDESMLVRNLGRYVSAGLSRGDGLIVIASARRTQSIACELERQGLDTAQAVRDRHLLFLDAQETLDRFLVDGRPQWHLFEATIRSAMRSIHARRRAGHTGIRLYGEMIGSLWAAGQTSAAIRLQEFWNKLLESITFDLFHGYPVSDEALRNPDFQKLVRADTRILTGEDVGGKPAGAAGSGKRAE